MKSVLTILRWSWVATVLACIGTTTVARAEVRLPRVFGDHMLLQCDMPIRIWGWAAPGERVSVEMTGKSAAAETGADGKWQLELPAMKAGGPYTLSVTGNNRLRIEDVLVGELWLGSGQSNMAWVMVHKTTNFDAEIAAANYPQIRLFTVPQVPQPVSDGDRPREDFSGGEWLVCSPKTVGYFSAVAYYFGRELNRELQVPVGLIVSAVSGTRIEPWTPAVGVESVPALTGKDKPIDGELFNTMIHPLLPLRLRGVIWYQGEGNVSDGFIYYHRTHALINGWRKRWNQGDFPFYYVQLAPFNWGVKPKHEHAEIWEAQAAAMDLPNTGMVVTNDIGNVGDAHPRNKRDVGIRLANWALAETYGRTDTPYQSPMFASCQVDGDKIRIAFRHTAGGLKSRDGKPLTWFTIAGGDGRFVPATAIIDGDSVVVSSAEVKQPTAVRYAWHQIAEPNLMNAAGLPAPAFRTDGPMPQPKAKVQKNGDK